MRAGESVAYRESPGQTAKLGSSVIILKLRGWIDPFFFSFFCDMRKLLMIFSESEVLWTFFGFS